MNRPTPKQILSFIGMFIYMSVEAITVSDVFLTDFGLRQDGATVWQAMQANPHIVAAVIAFSYMALLIAFYDRSDSLGFKEVVTGLIIILNTSYAFFGAGDLPFTFAGRLGHVLFPLLFGVMMGSIYYKFSTWFASERIESERFGLMRDELEQARKDAEKARIETEQVRNAIYSRWEALKPDTLDKYARQAEQDGNEALAQLFRDFLQR